MLETCFRFVEHFILVCFAPAASEGLGTQLLASANRPDSPIMPKFRAPIPKSESRAAYRFWAIEPMGTQIARTAMNLGTSLFVPIP